MEPPAGDSDDAASASPSRFVAMAVSLQLSMADFSADMRGKFIAGVASAAGVTVSNVEITNIVEVTSRRSAGRSLLATSVKVRLSCKPPWRQPGSK